MEAVTPRRRHGRGAGAQVRVVVGDNRMQKAFVVGVGLLGLMALLLYVI